MHHSSDLNRDVGMMEGASSLGYLFGPLMSGLLYDSVGFRPLFFIFTAPFVALLAAACLAPHAILPGVPLGRPPKAERRQEKLDEAEQGGAFVRALKILSTAPTYLAYIALVLLVAGALGLMDTTLAEHLEVALQVTSFQAGAWRGAASALRLLCLFHAVANRLCWLAWPPIVVYCIDPASSLCAFCFRRLI